MAETATGGGVGAFFGDLLNRSKDIALNGASRYIDAEIAQRVGIVESDTRTGVDPGQQRLPTTTAQTATSNEAAMFGGSVMGWALLGFGVLALVLVAKR